MNNKPLLYKHNIDIGTPFDVDHFNQFFQEVDALAQSIDTSLDEYETHFSMRDTADQYIRYQVGALNVGESKYILNLGIYDDQSEDMYAMTVQNDVQTLTNTSSNMLGIMLQPQVGSAITVLDSSDTEIDSLSYNATEQEQTYLGVYILLEPDYKLQFSVSDKLKLVKDVAVEPYIVSRFASLEDFDNFSYDSRFVTTDMFMTHDGTDPIQQSNADIRFEREIGISTSSQFAEDYKYDELNTMYQIGKQDAQTNYEQLTKEFLRLGDDQLNRYRYVFDNNDFYVTANAQQESYAKQQHYSLLDYEYSGLVRTETVIKHQQKFEDLELRLLSAGNLYQIDVTDQLVEISGKIYLYKSVFQQDATLTNSSNGIYVIAIGKDQKTYAFANYQEMDNMVEIDQNCQEIVKVLTPTQYETLSAQSIKNLVYDYPLEYLVVITDGTQLVIKKDGSDDELLFDSNVVQEYKLEPNKATTMKLVTNDNDQNFIVVAAEYHTQYSHNMQLLYGYQYRPFWHDGADYLYDNVSFGDDVSTLKDTIIGTNCKLSVTQPQHIQLSNKFGIEQLPVDKDVDDSILADLLKQLFYVPYKKLTFKKNTILNGTLNLGG